MERLLITRRDVEALTGLKRAFIYRAMSVGQFPKPVKIGPKAVRWVEAEIREWVQNRIAESLSREVSR